VSYESSAWQRIQWDEPPKGQGLMPLVEQWGIGRSRQKASRSVEPTRLEDTFARLVADWRRETQNISSLSDLMMHPAYQRVIGLGRPVVPIILRELQKEPDHWHWALNAITGEDPVPLEHTGDLDAIAADWLRWARTGRSTPR
jgi:hypothetical protein